MDLVNLLSTKYKNVVGGIFVFGEDGTIRPLLGASAKYKSLLEGITLLEGYMKTRTKMTALGSKMIGLRTYMRTLRVRMWLRGCDVIPDLPDLPPFVNWREKEKQLEELLEWMHKLAEQKEPAIVPDK